MKKYWSAYLLVAGASLLLFACQKGETSIEDPANEVETSASKISTEADVEAEVIFDGLFDDAMGVNAEVGLGGTGVFGRLTACPTVTVTRLNSPAAFPVRVVLDVGAGCVARDGHLRKGKIIHVYTNRLINPGAVVETSFDGFYFDSIKVEGTHRIQNITTQTAGPQYKINVNNGKLTRPNGNFIAWNSEKVRTQIEGMITPILPADDVFKLTGGSRGSTRRDTTLIAWNATITEPLIRNNNCRWIVKGAVRVVRENTNTGDRWAGLINYGNGICDNIATVTINGISYTITLP
ncbi:MAG: hypothetical protein ACO3AY_05535 [Chitinophagaceae bacterium]